MAVIAHVVLEGVTRDQYDAVRAACGWAGQETAGGIAHLTWWDGDDNHNVDAWESEAAFGAFGQDRLGPALAQVGVEAGAKARLLIWPTRSSCLLRRPRRPAPAPVRGDPVRTRRRLPRSPRRRRCDCHLHPPREVGDAAGRSLVQPPARGTNGVVLVAGDTLEHDMAMTAIVTSDLGPRPRARARHSPLGRAADHTTGHRGWV